MEIEINYSDLVELVKKQIESIFMFNHQQEIKIIKRGVDSALERCEYCFSKTKNKYYSHNGKVYFNPFHSGQYTIFLYFLSNSIYRFDKSYRTLADRIYYLNKCLNGLDLFYEVNLPKVFFLDHPIGSVIGRACFGEFFSFSQNCTVGNNKGIYPMFGSNVKMMSGSKVLGRCKIGNNVIISANTYVKDTNIPSYSLVFGSSPNLTIKHRRPDPRGAGSKKG